MCQQSLINYLSACLAQAGLATELTDCHSRSSLSGNPVVLKEDIETLIHTGEQVSENEIAALIKEQNIKEGKQKTSGYKLQLSESIRSNAALIDEKLADITVCDPAVGSGAFPVGMMSEIVRARNVLSVFLNDNSRTAYEFKRRCIEHSLYGVDIDPGAVEIAKLRLWLSLVERSVYCRNVLQDAPTGTSHVPDVGAIHELPLQKGEFLAATFSDAAQLDHLENTLSEIGFPMPVKALKPEGWNLEPPEVLALMEKLRKAGTPLDEYVKGRFYYGIKTGLNEAFVIDKQTRERLIAEDPKSEELIKPWLRGRDIKKWKAEWAGLYIINIPSSTNKQWPWTDKQSEKQARDTFKHSYPAVHDHLSQWEDKLRKRDDKGRFWWELRSCAYYSDFQQTKIIYPDIAQKSKFTWDESKAFLGNTAYIIPTEKKWLLGLLNSQLIWWLYLHISSTIQGGFVRFIAQYMEQLPIPFLSDKQNVPIIESVQKILTNPDSPDVPRLEKEIDKLIYELYGLTPEEIEIVEGRG